MSAIFDALLASDDEEEAPVAPVERGVRRGGSAIIDALLASDDEGEEGEEKEGEAVGVADEDKEDDDLLLMLQRPPQGEEEEERRMRRRLQL